MRPEILFPLFAPVNSLPGIGPRFAKLLEKRVGPSVVDLLWHLPCGLIDRRFSPTIREAPAGAIVTIRLRVETHLPGHGNRPTRVRCFDGSGFLHLIFFHAKGDYLLRLLPPGSERLVSGRIEHFNNEIQITHPDYVLAPEDAAEMRPIEPVYGLTAGLTPRIVQKSVGAALGRLPALPEWLDPALRQRRGWPAWQDAIHRIHAPESEADIAPETPARQRLAYDELLASQLAIALVRAHNKRQRGRAIRGDGTLRRAVIDALPFRLTGAQLHSLAEIDGDMGAPTRMLRLLQGDVGSGKTVVALLAMLNAVETGAQAALLAPTEILCRQHLATLSRLAAPAGIEIVLLTGREKGRSRDEIRAKIASGAASIIIGTHALLQEDIAFRDLALAVIDEQHRFGVEQRVALGRKGNGVDLLVMTATPIPRTLLLTSYGDLDASFLRDKPAGRQTIATRTVPLTRIEEVLAAIGRALEKRAKVYWICPLVEESETLDIAAADERHRQLAEIFPGRVGLVHGRLKGAEKDAVMQGFADGGTDLLVATTVVEVGVDVPAATIMVIEHAERFGLAQLHQLRGRVGRGDAASTCLLLYAAPLGETAEARLRIIRESDDGFRIAEEDLRLRGGGEVLGTRQSGMPELRLADPLFHRELLDIAHDDARLILARDAALETPRGQALRVLLYLFRRDEAIRYLESG